MDLSQIPSPPKLRRCTCADISQFVLDMETTKPKQEPLKPLKPQLQLYWEPFGAHYETSWNGLGQPIPTYKGSQIRVFGDSSKNPNWMREINSSKWVYKFTPLSGKYEHLNLGFIFRGNEKYSVDEIRIELIKMGIKRWQHVDESVCENDL